jgi:hypothetical protein
MSKSTKKTIEDRVAAIERALAAHNEKINSTEIAIRRRLESQLKSFARYLGQVQMTGRP